MKRPVDIFHPAAHVVKIRTDAGVRKIALKLKDGALVESVYIPMPPRGDGVPRHTLCLSTQVGCAMGCAFCATGRMGLVRHLDAEEISAQAEVIEMLIGRPDNLVFMGMGEPLHNFDNWRAAVERLIESKRKGEKKPQGYSTHQMTVSTCGYVPGMRRLATQGFRKMGLALSLNAPSDPLRTRLMPVNKRWPMSELRAVIESLPLRNGIFLTEYVLFAGLNDRDEHAEQLAQYLSGLRTLVNLIAYNPAPGLDEGEFKRPSPAAVRRFKKRLLELGLYARLRDSKGRRIAAACGQLASEPMAKSPREHRP